jgi:hypothetical protein
MTNRRRSWWNRFALVALAGAGCNGSDGGVGADGGMPDTLVASTPDELLDVPASCAFTCDSTCEPQGYACPALADWSAIPHADSCGGWDGTKVPTPQQGHCAASLPSGEAVKKMGADPSDPATTILPSGARAKPAGKSSVFADYKGQFPTNLAQVPATDLVVVLDGGVGEQSVRLVDVTRIGTAMDPVVGREKFAGALSVNYGVVVLPAATTGIARAYVSGSAGSVVYAFDVDVNAKTLARRSDEDVKLANDPKHPGGGGLGGGYLISGLALAPSGKRLVVATGNSRAGTTPLFVVDVDSTSSTYRKVLSAFGDHAAVRRRRRLDQLDVPEGALGVRSEGARVVRGADQPERHRRALPLCYLLGSGRRRRRGHDDGDDQHDRHEQGA